MRDKVVFDDYKNSRKNSKITTKEESDFAKVFLLKHRLIGKLGNDEEIRLLINKSVGLFRKYNVEVK
jgi:hypothetical protein